MCITTLMQGRARGSAFTSRVSLRQKPLVHPFLSLPTHSSSRTLHTHKHTQSEFVNTYSAYMNEFRVAMQTLAKYEQSSLEFRELVLKCQHSSGCKGLSLSAYLLTPIQRLPRYELLLKVRPSVRS